MQDHTNRNAAQRERDGSQHGIPARRFATRSTEQRSDPEHRLLHGLLQSLDFPLYVIDANTYEIILANAAMCRNGPPWGFTCHSLTHHRDTPCDGAEGACPLEAVRRTKRPVSVEHRHYGADGTVRYFEIHALPILDSEGRLTEMIEYNVDVTEHRRAMDELRTHERALERLTHQLELSNEELATFASVAAHDVQSPLQTISAAAAALELILGKQTDARVQHALEILLGGVARLSETITSLYRCSQAGTGALQLVDVDLARVVRELCTFQLARAIEASGARVHVAEPLHDVRGDEMQMLELLQNLISNAVKFRRDTVAPEIFIRTLELARGWIRIEVEDNGIGIPEADHQRIFDMFTRLDPGDAASGLGIGLAFCQRVTQRHGGRIGVQSTGGSGSTFWVELPPAQRDGAPG